MGRAPRVLRPAVGVVSDERRAGPVRGAAAAVPAVRDLCQVDEEVSAGADQASVLRWSSVTGRTRSSPSVLLTERPSHHESPLRRSCPFTHASAKAARSDDRSNGNRIVRPECSCRVLGMPLSSTPASRFSRGAARPVRQPEPARARPKYRLRRCGLLCRQRVPAANPSAPSGSQTNASSAREPASGSRPIPWAGVIAIVRHSPLTPDQRLWP
jgi:hypothetical protein